MSAALAGFAEVLSLRMNDGPIGSTAPSPAVFAALDQIADSVLVVRPLRGDDSEIADFAILCLSPGYIDPAGGVAGEAARDARVLAGLTLLEAYPASTAGDGLFARARRVLASGRAEHVPGTVAAPLTGDVDRVKVADLHAVPFFAGVVFTWRMAGEAEQRADLLGHAQRLGQHRRLGGEPRRRDGPLDRGRVRPVRAGSAARRADPDSRAAQLRDRRGPRAGPAVPAVAADAARVRRGGVPHRPAWRHGDQADPDLRRARPGWRRCGGAARRVPGRLRAVPHPGRARRDPRPAGRQRAARRAGAPARAPPAARHHGGGRAAGGGVGGGRRGALPPGRARAPGGGGLVRRGADARQGPAARGGGHHRSRHRRGDRHDRRAQRAARARRDRRGPGRAAQAPQLRGLPPHRGHRGTVVCGSYDPDSRVLRWARAGHLPPVLVRDGAARTLPLPGGVLLGLDPDAEYEEASSSCGSATSCCCSPTA